MFTLFPKQIFGIPGKMWIILVILYFLPPFLENTNLGDQYFHGNLWLLYLIPTLMLVYFNGKNVGIARQKELELKLIESEDKYKSLVEKSLVGVYLIQNNKLVYVNEWFKETLGFSSEELLGTNFIDYIRQNDRTKIINKFKTLIAKEITFLTEEIQIHTKNQTTKFLELQASLTTINGSFTIIGIALDVTDKKDAQAELEYIAYHDLLTGILNMKYLNRYLPQDLNLNKANKLPVSLLFYNLDRFKLINDSYGHHIGDLLLKKVSERLVKVIHNKGTVIRAGGDDFILYLPNMNAPEAEQLSKLLLEEFSESVHIQEHEIRVTASIGIAAIEKDDSLDTAIQKASLALNFAKESGRNQYQFYSAEFREIANRRLQLEQGIHKAFEQNELEVFYQPKLDLLTNQITGMEALTRWNDPLHGAISPNEFIPVSEETGTIIPLGKWVLETACKQASEWLKDGYPPIQVCVNISSRQFLQNDFVRMIEKALSESELAAEYLNLEITEGIALHNMDDAIKKLEQIKQLGVSISLDDFGTGYSSLNYLKSLPIDYLKIDRTFITDNFENQDAAIIDSFISLAHSLGLKVVAEGVENEQQLEMLTRMSCDEIQGYYLSEPLSADQFKQFIGKKLQIIT